MTPFAYGYFFGRYKEGRERVMRRANAIKNRRYAMLMQLGMKKALQDIEEPNRKLTDAESIKLLKLLNEKPELDLWDMAKLLKTK